MNFLFLSFSYLIGSIPFALLIGKIFYKKDLRNEGSGNLGTTNTFRVLGKKAGLVVAFFDISKGFFVMFLAFVYTDNWNLLIFGVAAILGHALSIFIKFKGGKSVATTFGVFLFYEPIIMLVAIFVFFISLKISKYVSLSSIITILFSFVLSIFLSEIVTIIVLLLIGIFITYKHKENLIRIKNKTEPKVKWI